MEDALRRAKMSVQPLKTSDTLACPGTPRCRPILKSSKPVRRSPLARSRRVLVRSRATVEARPTPSGKPRHARSPDRLPVNFRFCCKVSFSSLWASVSLGIFTPTFGLHPQKPNFATEPNLIGVNRIGSGVGDNGPKELDLL